MKRSIILSFIFVSFFMLLFSTNLVADIVTFSGIELLGKPTDQSITINIVPDSDIEYYYEYGTTQGGPYTNSTTPTTLLAGDPGEVTLTGLSPNTRYYYRMVYDGDGDVNDGDFEVRSEFTFHTQRSAGEAFIFTIISDSHLNNSLGSNTTLYNQACLNVAADNPDFHLDLGDTFFMDQLSDAGSPNNDAEAEIQYLSQRPYMGNFSHSAAVFISPGNHEQEEGWNFDDTPVSEAILGLRARKKYWPNPIPDGFYSGNTDLFPSSPPPTYADNIGDDQFREDYFAWEWGDALFIVFDPFQYTMSNPYGNFAGEGSDDPATNDRWDWTLGQQQFNWLKSTLENSTAKYKFMFAHHMLGGTQNYVRGGAEPAHQFEWGGYNADGTTWGWDTQRPGWGNDPIHQLMIDNDVSAFFHGHDHQYAYEVRDNIVYQSMPAPSMTGNGFNLYSESDPYTIKVLPNSGHLRVTITDTEATVDYINSSLTGTNGDLTYSYTIAPAVAPGPEISISGTPLNNFSAEPGSPSVEQNYTISGSLLTDDITITAPTDFEISTSSGTGFGSSIILPQSGGDVAETTIFVRFNRVTTGTSSDNITHTSNGAATQNVAISGTAAESGTLTLDGLVSNATADDVNSIDISHTTGTGLNRLMLVGVSWNSGSNEREITSVTFSYGAGPTVLTLNEVFNQQAASQPRNAAIYSYLNPPGGEAGTLTVNFDGAVSNGIVAGAVNFSGVDQSTPLGSAAGADASSSAAPNVSLSGLNGNELIFDTIFQGASGETQTLTAGVNQSELWNSWIANVRAAASIEQASGSSATISWTAASSSIWAIAAVPINASGDDPLPVGLSSFSAQLTKEGVELKWITESQINNAGFEIWRNEYTSAQFTKIASYLNDPALIGDGSSSTDREYVFLDKTVEKGKTYSFKISDVDYSGQSTFHDAVTINIESTTPSTYKLYPNYPNPFNPETKIRFYVPDNDPGNKLYIYIYNISGQLVRTMIKSHLSSGIHEFTWRAENSNGTKLPSGIYLLELKAQNYRQVQKMILLK